MLILAMNLFLMPAYEQENRIKILQFQYEEKLKELRIENAKLQQRSHDLETQLKQAAEACTPTEAKASKTKKPKAAPPKTNSTDDDFALYQASLDLIGSENWNEAILSLERLVKSYPSSQYADNALYLMSEVYRFKGQLELARIELLRLLKDYPSSDRRYDAKTQLEKIESFQSAGNH